MVRRQISVTKSSTASLWVHDFKNEYSEDCGFESRLGRFSYCFASLIDEVLLF